MSDYSDIIIVGAGPVGLLFARQFKNTSLRVTVIEKHKKSVLQDPPFDGREIALTHFSQYFLKRSGIWDLIPSDSIYPLKEAQVMNGTSEYRLFFPHPKQARGKKIDRLGFLVSNCNIRKACYEAVSQLENVTIINEVSVDSLSISPQCAQVKLSDRRILQTSLLIAADGRFSHIRQMVGIPADIHQFGRTVICFRMSHEKSNEHRACEMFHYGRTLAVLPLTSHLSSMVITIDSHLSEHIVNLTPEETAEDIYHQLKGRLGIMKLRGEKVTYPLSGIHARRFYDRCLALIGDAAVGMHPVTAHGFNLGVESVAHLSQLVLHAYNKGQDIASKTLLQRYDIKHQAKTRLLYHATNFLVKLYTTENIPAKALRNILLRFGNHFPPIKNLITKQLTG